MVSPKRVTGLLLVLASLSTGCASTNRYPFREKPRPPIDRQTQSQDDEDHRTLERELSMYSD